MKRIGNSELGKRGKQICLLFKLIVMKCGKEIFQETT